MSPPVSHDSPRAGAAADPSDREALGRARVQLGRWIADRWHLDEVIGVGGMATVYAATDRKGARAAIKILHAELSVVPPIRDRFVREAQVSREISHPGCVAYLDEGVTELGEPYLGMELLEGRTLETLCQQRGDRLPVNEALRIASGVLEALGAFHAHAVVHRDLKPGNIFLTSQGEVKLLDLGIAQMRVVGQDATRPGLAVGTPAYMSPEQAMGRRHLVDARSDLYSLGATLHLLLSGVRVHHGLSDDEALVRAATQPAASLARAAPDLPVDVIAVVDKALQWDRRNRFQSAEEMRLVVDRLLAADPGPGNLVGTERLAPPEPAREERAPMFALDEEWADAPARAHHDLPPPSTDLSPTPNASSAVLELESLLPPRGASPLPLSLPLTPRPPAIATAAGSAPGEGTSGVEEQPGEAVSASELSPSLRVLFELIDRLLRTARQYGPAHPETQTRIEPVHRALLAALEADGSQVHWRVLPFCFMHDDVVAWEPAPPGDLVPYLLSVAGLREVRILPGVGEEEVRDLLGAMMVDANSDPADVAATLWEAPFSRIECRLEEDLPSEDAATLDDLATDTEELQREIERAIDADPSAAQSLVRSMSRSDLAEAAAMASTLDAERVSAAAALALDPTTTSSLRSEVALDPQDLAARHVDVVLEAWADALTRRDPSILASPFAALARRLIRTGRHEELYALHAAMLARLEALSGSGRGRWPAPQLITAALFPEDVLRHLVHLVTHWSHLLTEEQVETASASLERVTRTLGPGALPRCLGIVRETADGPALELLLDYVVRVAPGQAQAVLDELESMRPLVAQRLLERLARDAGPEARSLLEPLLRSPNSLLRCEALALLSGSSEQLCAELLNLFGSDVEEVRLAALDTFVRHRVVSAGPALVRWVQHETFVRRPPTEQRRVFEALWAINPRRSESLLGDMVGRHGLIPDSALDETRMLALDLLAERAASRDALEAVQSATRRRPWNSAKVREVATAAAHAIAERLGSGAPSGEGVP